MNLVPPLESHSQLRMKINPHRSHQLGSLPEDLSGLASFGGRTSSWRCRIFGCSRLLSCQGAARAYTLSLNSQWKRPKFKPFYEILENNTCGHLLEPERPGDLRPWLAAIQLSRCGSAFVSLKHKVLSLSSPEKGLKFSVFKIIFEIILVGTH